MAATTTAFSDLLSQLQNNYPQLTFRKGEAFRWSAHESVVYYGDTLAINAPVLLHEASHGILGHNGYTYDLELIQIEREAWNKAVTLGETYGYSIDSESIEDALDTYRQWLHERSTCPNCSQNGVQTSEQVYECLVCQQKWRVNEARNCGLKRIKL